MELSGADILMECLLEQGVDTVFGYPGGAVLYIYDSLFKYKDKITHYLTSHEQGASHAADGYARSTGKVGVLIATSGPGATNIITGLATAFMDSIPIVAITGNVTTNLLGRDSFQEVHISGIALPVTKHTYVVKDVSTLAETVRSAFEVARSGRPGPVLIDITKDVTAKTYEYVKNELLYNEETHTKKYNNDFTEEDLNIALNLIKEASRPVIMVGGGVVLSDAGNQLLKFCERMNCPVVQTLMGLSALDGNYKNCTGLVGMHGSKASNVAITKSDLIIAIGARFSDRVVSNSEKFAPNAKILHIDIDPAEINKNVRSVSHLIGDAKIVLTKLLDRLISPNCDDFLAEIMDIKNKTPLAYQGSKSLKPQFVLETISNLMDDSTIVATEVGQHQIWAGHYIKFKKPRTFLTSGGLGTMGYGLGAAIGAAVGNKGCTVFNIAGDGCFRMNCNELATAVAYDLPVIICIMNNHALGMVRQWQSMFYDERFSSTTLDKTTDFVELAKAYKALAFNVTKKEEVLPTLKKAIESKKCVVINFEISENEFVYPMVPPGAGIDEVIIK